MFSNYEILGFLSGVSIKVYDDLVDDFEVAQYITDTAGILGLVLSTIFLYVDASYRTFSLVTIISHCLLLLTENQNYKQEKEGINTDLFKIGAFAAVLTSLLKSKETLDFIVRYKELVVICSLILVYEITFQYPSDVEKISLRVVGALFLSSAIYCSKASGNFSDLRPIAMLLLGYVLTSIVSLSYQKVNKGKKGLEKC